MEGSEPLKPLAVTIKQACRLLNLGRTKVYELIEDGRLITTTIGRRRLVIYTSLEALLHRDR